MKCRVLICLTFVVLAEANAMTPIQSPITDSVREDTFVSPFDSSAQTHLIAESPRCRGRRLGGESPATGPGTGNPTLHPSNSEPQAVSAAAPVNPSLKTGPSATHTRAHDACPSAGEFWVKGYRACVSRFDGDRTKDL